MKAVILVGGEATRLLPLTHNIPKAIVPVLNTPFLEHVIRHLGKHRVKDIVLAQGHLAGSIESYFGDGSQLGVRLYYSTEDTPLGSAGAAKNAERYLDGSFLVLNGDVFTDLDITAMIDFHQQRRAKTTIAVIPVEDPTSFGLVVTDNQGRVTRFHEKPGWSEVTAYSTYLINAGAWLVEPDVLSQIPSQTQFSFERNVFPLLLAQGEPVYAYPLSGYWMDMGTPEKYLQLHRDLLSGSSEHYAQGEEVIIGEQCDIHSTAQIEGPVVIGDNCTIGENVKLTGPVVIGDGCTILQETVIEDSVIWHNVKLGQQAKLKHSIVADHCRLNANSLVEDSVLGDNVTVVSSCTLESGSKIWPGETVETGTQPSSPE